MGEKSKAMELMVARKKIVRQMDKLDPFRNPKDIPTMKKLGKQAGALMKQAEEAGDLTQEDIMKLALVY